MAMILVFTLLFSALLIGGGRSGTQTQNLQQGDDYEHCIVPCSIKINISIWVLTDFFLSVRRNAEDMSLVISKEEHRVLDSTEERINDEEDLDFEHVSINNENFLWFYFHILRAALSAADGSRGMCGGR